MAKHIVTLTERVRIGRCYYNAGETIGVTKDQRDDLLEDGSAKPYTTAPTRPAADKAMRAPAPKGEQRDKLAEMAEDSTKARIRQALDADDYNAMRTLLAELSDKPTPRKKAEVRAALEAMLG